MVNKNASCIIEKDKNYNNNIILRHKNHGNYIQ